MVTNRKKGLHLATQERLLKKNFPTSRCWYPKKTLLVWEGVLKPTPFSIDYKLQVVYEIGKAPEVFVIEPKKLALYPGKSELEHVYDQEKQKLCLYYPDGKEWKSSMLLANTTIPWAAEWLYFYEIWLYTGEWKGGGIHLSS